MCQAVIDARKADALGRTKIKKEQNHIHKCSGWWDDATCNKLLNLVKIAVSSSTQDLITTLKYKNSLLLFLVYRLKYNILKNNYVLEATKVMITITILVL